MERKDNALIKTLRGSQLWLPAAMWALFVIMVIIMHGDPHAVDAAAGFLGVVLPLTGGVLGAYALLESPALELEFSTPRPAWKPVVTRLGMVLGVMTVAAVSYQLFLAVIGLDMSSYGSLVVRQMAWIIPGITFTIFGCFLALASTQPSTASMLLGAIWIGSLFFRKWFMTHAVARYFFLFTATFKPENPQLGVISLGLVGLSILLLFGSIELFKKQERYIG